MRTFEGNGRGFKYVGVISTKKCVAPSNQGHLFLTRTQVDCLQDAFVYVQDKMSAAVASSRRMMMGRYALALAARSAPRTGARNISSGAASGRPSTVGSTRHPIRE